METKHGSPKVKKRNRRGQETMRNFNGVPDGSWAATEYYFWVFIDSLQHELLHYFFLKKTCT